jgi:hypothetical protein
MTTSQKGAQAASTYFTKRKQEDIQRDRDDILATTADDIRGFSEMIRKILDQNAICVYGNAEKINQEKDLFDNLIKLEKNTENRDKRSNKERISEDPFYPCSNY